jgi:hypothetical protein
MSATVRTSRGISDALNPVGSNPKARWLPLSARRSLHADPHAAWFDAGPIRRRRVRGARSDAPVSELESRLGERHQPAMTMALPLMLSIYFRFRRHGGLGRTCYWLAAVANDPNRTLRRSAMGPMVGPLSISQLLSIDVCSIRGQLCERIEGPGGTDDGFASAGLLRCTCRGGSCAGASP